MTEVSVLEFFKGKTIFITGGTGFMGKVLIEKLLYSCSDLKQILMIIRPKKGKSPKQRIESIVSLPMFDRIRSKNPLVLNKLFPVFGDVSAPNFGLNDEHLEKVLMETNVVFHLAANLKMKDDLKDAVEMNLMGTQYILEMARKMSNLVSIVHLSTAYCNIDQKVAEEKVYGHSHKPKNLIECAKWMDEKLMSNIIKPLIGPPENIYVYTKRLAENLVRDEFPNLPICIARPSIVTPAFMEPMPGWVDNMNGPTGLLAGGAKGVVRIALCNPETRADIIPVDMAINALITISAFNGSWQEQERPKDIPVYNLTSNGQIKITWGEIIDQSKKINYEFPVETGIWYPDGGITSNRLIYKAKSFIYHFLPALIIDFLLLCCMQKRFMMRIYEKVSQGIEVLSFFSTKEWHFPNSKLKEIEKMMIESERKIFCFDHTKIVSIPDYIKDAILGGRQYFLKEPLSTIPKARQQLKIMWCIDRFVKLVIFTFLLKWILSFFA